MSPSQVSTRAVTRLTLMICVVAVLIGLAACISAPPKKPNLIEQVKKENDVGSRLAKQFEAKLKLREDVAVDAYLQKLGKLLEKASGDPRLENTEVVVIQDRSAIWRSFSLQGKRVYLSLGWLKKMNTDSEVAALIAMELGHIQQRQVLNHLQQNPEDPDQKKIPDFFGEKGLFTYNKGEMEGAIQSAVGILYKAGFDSRGLILDFQTERSLQAHSVFSATVLESIIQSARDTVDSYPPLINPIVRTQRFSAIRKRIQTL
jgi:hypothetical protein